ncbi:putative phage abortive infection protein [Niallia sp. FSL W8-0177]|uniref:putative phage abortive infection protein n=1 Tax=Niallia TaxID=2837506 RepID=UPI002E221A51|nr:putative phage abortive infection protein [Niallia circulans]
MKRWFSEKWKKIENRYIFSAIIAIGIAILLPIGIYLFRNKNHYSTLDALGPVGDFLGGSTIAFFNIASILMLVAAIVMQKEELSLQRKEVEATREEYKITNQTMKKQQFDSIFFNLIGLHNEIVKEISIDNNPKGRKSLNQYYYTVTNNIGLTLAKNSQMVLERIKISFQEKDSEIGHYLRNLKRIIILVNNTVEEIDTKKIYYGILRDQLTTQELMLLFLYVVKIGNEDFKEVILINDFFSSELDNNNYYTALNYLLN